MTTININIEDKVYKRMKRHSEVSWNKFLKTAIKKQLDDLDLLKTSKNKESTIAMLASESVLTKEWDTPEDERWNTV